jgi:pimeloyl-ACP methyl ester carboxylesterase
VVEFLDAVEPLAHPERFGGDIGNAFTIIAPSLPGYGFSDPPDAPITPRDIGRFGMDCPRRTRMRTLRRSGRR